MRFEQKQKALASTQSLLEELAARNANIETNDIINQAEYRMDDDHMAVTGIQSGVSQTNQFEFEPALFQACFESQIPPQILEQILESAKDPSSVVKQGILVDNIVFFTVNKTLFLWNAGSTRFGLPVEDKPQQSRKRQTSNYSVREFKTRIDHVCYLEDYSKDFMPYLCVATQSEIQVFSFKLLDQSSLHTHMSQTAVKRCSFDLTVLQESGLQAYPLDTNEERVTVVA